MLRIASRRVAFTAPASEGVALDPAGDLVDGGGSELDNMERVEDGAGVVDGVLYPWNGSKVATFTPARKSLGPVQFSV